MQLPLASRNGRAEGLFLLLGLVAAGFAYWAWTSPAENEAPPPGLDLPALKDGDPVPVVDVEVDRVL